MVRGQRRGRVLSPLPIVVALALLIGFAPTALAAPADRETAVAEHQSVLEDFEVGAGWTGSVKTCTVGTESAQSLSATRHTVNVLRSFAGLGPVSFDAEKNRRALAAALMMRAANDLSHSPGPSWPCYSDAGREGAETSNLALGFSGARAMVGYVDDAGVENLGHRLWLLNPDAVSFGSGSTGTTNALTTVGAEDGSPSTTPADNVLAWPPPGWVPWPWVFTDWSATFGNPASDVDVNGASVAVTINGSPAPVSNVRAIDNLVTYEDEDDTLAWNVDIPAATRAADAQIAVEISGVTVNGANLPVSYEIDAFDPPGDPGGSDGNLELSVSAKERQRPTKRAIAKIRAGCDEVCDLLASGKVTLKGSAASSAKRKLKLKKARASLGSAGVAVLKLKATKRVRRKLFSALKKGAKAKVKATVTATGNSGQRLRTKGSIALRR